MAKAFKVTPEIAEYIKLQRTEFQNLPNNKIGKAYYTACLNDFNSFKEYLPNIPIQYILDIGAGVGGIDIFLYQQLGRNSYFYLIDKNKKDSKIIYGYSDTPSAYNNFQICSKFFKLNKFSVNRYSYIENFTIKNHKFEIILSLLSCGFHYPVTFYLDTILNKISDNGIVIFDIRKKTDQIKILQKVFSQVIVAKEFTKYQRVICKK